MLIGWLLAGFASIAVSATSAWAEAALKTGVPKGETSPIALPLEGAETSPVFITRPTGEDMARFYPSVAQTIGLSGRVMLDCNVSALGALDECKASGESPAGMGFAKAALGLASIFRLRPRTVDGVAVGGGVFETVIRFQTPEISPPPQLGSVRYPTPTPAATVLAKRLAIAMGSEHRMGDMADSYARQLEAQFEREPATDAIETRAKQVTLDAFKQAMAAKRSIVIDGLAKAFAATFSEKDLGPIVAFMESAAARVWFERQPEQSAASVPASYEFWAQAREDAVRQICVELGCGVSGATAKAAAH